MPACPFHSVIQNNNSRTTGFTLDQEIAFLNEVHTGSILTKRSSVYAQAIEKGDPVPFLSDELTWAGRIAWRNQSRCIGRLFWRSLTVRDQRSLKTADEIAESLRSHLELAQTDGTIKSVMTVFAPNDPKNGTSPRIWNNQLCSYAGYKSSDGSILGDPKNSAVTELALKLGWNCPTERSRFDLLPWIISGNDGKPHLFELEDNLVREIQLSHPKYTWFEKLKLKWYAVPIVSDMTFHAAGTNFTAAPFNGWYMGTEIGARDLSDEQRYNQLPVIAEKLGLEQIKSMSLWKDRALLELNEAVLYSFAKEGIKIVDHHTASTEFTKFCNQETKAGRSVSAKWDWIIPPLSPATTEVFHIPMKELPLTPHFEYLK